MKIGEGKVGGCGVKVFLGGGYSSVVFVGGGCGIGFWAGDVRDCGIFGLGGLHVLCGGFGFRCRRTLGGSVGALGLRVLGL